MTSTRRLVSRAYGRGVVGGGPVTVPKIGPKPPLPATYPSLLGYYEAVMSPDVVGLNTSPDPDRVATWQRWGSDGKIKKNHVLAQGTQADQPEWEETPAGLLKPAIKFDASRGTALIDADAAAFWKALHDGSGCTMLVIIDPSFDASGAQLVFLTYSSTDGPGVAFIVSKSARVIVRDSDRDALLDVATGGVLPGGSEWSIVVARLQQGHTPELDIRVNGVSEATGSFSGTPSSDDPAIPVHVGMTDSGSIPNDGRFHALGLYDSWLSDTDVEAIEAYFNDLKDP